MKNLIIIFLLASSSLMAQNKEQKYYRVVEYFKSEERYIYFNWLLDYAATYKTANTTYGKGAIMKVESKLMASKEADKANKRNEKKKEKENYPHIKDPN